MESAQGGSAIKMMTSCHYAQVAISSVMRPASHSSHTWSAGSLSTTRASM